jgi:hypothetical protein
MGADGAQVLGGARRERSRSVIGVGLSALSADLFHKTSQIDKKSRYVLDFPWFWQRRREQHFGDQPKLAFLHDFLSNLRLGRRIVW